MTASDKTKPAFWKNPKAIGVVLLAAAVSAVIFVRLRPGPPELPEVVRPVKSVLLGGDPAGGVNRFPGRVRANLVAELGFEVPGQLIERKVLKGDRVKEGQVLARLNPSDFQNDLARAKAELKRTLAQVQRVQEAAAIDAVSRQDVSNAEAVYEKAKAEVKIKEKALEDTYLRARFDGVVANTYVDNFQNVQAKQPIVSLQDVSNVEIIVDVPESRVARSRPGDRDRYVWKAVFDTLPDRAFDVRVKEFRTEADPVTQTYQATFVMPYVKEINILPGMTVTIVETPKEEAPASAPAPARYSAPIEAVPVDGNGQYFVWRLTDEKNGIFTVRRANVTVGQISDDRIEIAGGVGRNDRIARTGVHLLQEGQRVKLAP